MYQICFYVPATHLNHVKQALFDNGAGKIRQYAQCAWQVFGEGQFMPLNGSHAFLGRPNSLEKVAEYKVEMMCEAIHLKKALTAFLAAHPYETPAYYVIKLNDPTKVSDACL